MPRRFVLLNALLALVAVGAVAYIVQEMTTPPRPAPLRPRAATDPAPAPAASPTPPAAPAAYSVVTARNLFSPSRSEAPVTAQARPVAMLPKPTLHGVVLRNGTPIAYLEDPQTKRVAGYRLGDAVAGGTVQAINADHIVLTRPEGAVDVRLRDPSKPRPAAAPLPTASSPSSPAAGSTGLPGAPTAPGLPPQPVAPGAVPPIPPRVQQPQPGQMPFPPRRMLPPNVLRRVPPSTSDAQP